MGDRLNNWHILNMGIEVLFYGKKKWLIKPQEEMERIKFTLSKRIQYDKTQVYKTETKY